MQTILYGRGLLAAETVSGGSSHSPYIIVVAFIAVSIAVSMPATTSAASSDMAR